MATGTAIFEAQITENGETLYPLNSKFTFSSNYSSFGKQQIAASGTDVSVRVTQAGTIGLAIFWADEGVTGNDLTVKINGSSQSFKVQPFLIVSENITAMTLTNSDTASAHVLNWRLLTT